jgi:hypothetical protein
MKKTVYFTLCILAGCNAPESIHRDIVRLHLSDPDSAVFRATFKAKRGNAWCGEVNAKTRMGGMVGFTKYVVTMPENSANDIESKRDSSSITFERSETFPGAWKAICAD